MHFWSEMRPKPNVTSSEHKAGARLGAFHYQPQPTLANSIHLQIITLNFEESFQIIQDDTCRRVAGNRNHVGTREGPLQLKGTLQRSSLARGDSLPAIRNHVSSMSGHWSILTFFEHSSRQSS
jgi:hypothetical protein